jgi:hypothetical protein
VSLLRLGLVDSLSMRQLADDLSCDPSNVTGIADRLVQIDLDGAPFEGGASGVAALPRRNGITIEKLFELRRDVVADRKPQKLSIETEDQRASGRAQPGRILGERR